MKKYTLSTKDVAAILGHTHRYFQDNWKKKYLNKRGFPAPVKTNGLRWNEEEVEFWVESQLVTA